MNLKLLISLLLVAGLIFISSCGKEEKQPELEKVESVDELMNDMDSVKTADSINKVIRDTVKATEKIAADKKEKEETDNTADVPTAKPGDYSTKPLEGTIVSLNGLVMGGSGNVNKAEAQGLAASGNLILFMATNGTVYFVYNEDGTFAGKKLANYANNQKVGMLGKSKNVGGLNIFIMTLIESM